MSTVYRARDLRFPGVERLCAIKEMVIAVEQPRLRQMRLATFRREAALLATLTHPSIPRIYDFFDLGGTIYLVLELVHGQDLETLLASHGGSYPQETVISWGLQLADVLSYLHHQTPEAIVFRDLKPSNIMLRPDDSLALVDFGIARHFATSQKGTMIGTEGYAPPEQYRGIADARGDIYAFGATLHQLATNDDPRDEPPFSVSQRPARQLNPSLSAASSDLITRCVAYDASDRFGSIDEVREALLLVRDAMRADSPVSEERVVPPAPRSVPATGDSSLLNAPDRLDWQTATNDEIRGAASFASGAIYVGSYDGHLYAIDEASGAVRWRYRTRGGVVSKPLIADDLVIVGSEDHSIYAVARQMGRLAWSYRTNQPVRSSASGDARGCGIGSDDGFVYRLNRSTGGLLWRFRTWGPVRSSPVEMGGSIVVGSDDGSIYCLDRNTGQVKWRTEIGAAVLSSAAVTRNAVVIGAADGAIRALHPQTGVLLWKATTGRAVIATPLIIKHRVYVGSADGSLYALDLAHGGIAWQAPLSRQITASASIDGDQVIVGGTDGVLFGISIEDGEVIWRVPIGTPIVSKPLITPDHIVVGGLNGVLYALVRGRAR